MWVNSKRAAEILDVKHKSLIQSIYRANKKGKKICTVKHNILGFEYVDGLKGGAGGKVLNIWIDENLQGDENDTNIRKKDTAKWQLGSDGSAHKEVGETWKKKETGVDVHGDVFDMVRDERGKGGTGGRCDLPYKEIYETEKNKKSESFSDDGLHGVRHDSRRREDGKGDEREVLSGGGAGEEIFQNLKGDKDDEHKNRQESSQVRVDNGRTRMGGSRDNVECIYNGNGQKGVQEAVLGNNRDDYDDGAVGEICQTGATKREDGTSFTDRGDIDENTSGQSKETSGAKTRDKDSDEKSQEVGNGSGDVGEVCVAERLGRGGETGKELVEAGGVGSTSLTCLLPTKKRKSEAFLQAPYEKRKEAELKLNLVREYEKCGKMRVFLKNLSIRYDVLNVTEGKVYRWLKSVREADKQGVNALDLLLDMRGKSEKPKALTEDMHTAMISMVLRNPSLSAAHIHKFLYDDFGDGVPEYSTVTRAIKKWKDEQVLIYDFAKNPDSATGKHSPAYGSYSENINYVNQLWELDATPADVITLDGKRHTLSAAIDVYSRRVVIVLAESASYTTLGQVMKKGILKLGIPDTVKTDNGKDYTSNYFDYTCARLRVNHQLVPPYRGDRKPHIERFFGTLSTMLFRALDEYCGPNVAVRTEIQNRQSFAHRLEAIKKWRATQKGEESFASQWSIGKGKKAKDIHLPMSKDELARWIDSWVIWYENRHIHSEIKTTPLKKWNESTAPIRKIEDERTLDILTGLTLERTVQKKGLNVLGLQYVHNELWMYSKQKVFVYTDDNLGYVYVYDMEQRFICRAECPEQLGVSRLKYIEARKNFDRATRKIAKALQTLRDDAPQRMIKHLTNELMSIGVDVPTKAEIKKEIQEEFIEAEVVEDVLVVEHKLQFDSVYDRFFWCLENDTWDELSLELKGKFPDDFARAEENFKIFKTA